MSTPYGLDAAVLLNREYGWVCIPLRPFTKVPALKGLFDDPPRTEAEIRTAWRRAQFAIDNSTAEEHLPHRGYPPNVGVLLGESGLLQLDADSPDEVQAWLSECTTHGFDAGQPTVQSPGTRGADGEMKHRDGGHWFYRQGDVEFSDRVLALPVGVGPEGGHAVMYGGKRLAVVPPSIRAEGAYVSGGGGAVSELPEFLRKSVEAHEITAALASNASVKSLPFGVSGEYRASDAEWAWSDSMDWLDLLPEGWVTTYVERDGHVVYARPGASSSRSAVAHPDGGCSHIRNGMSPAPLTLHTSNPGDFLDPVVAEKCPATVSKIRMYALKFYDGEVRQARIALGLAAQSPLAEPPLPVVSVAPEPTPAAPDTPPELAPPTWQPVNLAARIRDIMLTNAHPATPDLVSLILRAEGDAESPDWGARRAVIDARHVGTEWIAQQLGGISEARTHAVVRSLIPALQHAYGLIIRERLLDVGYPGFGSRTQPANRTAWAVWRPVTNLEGAPQ